MLEKQLQITEVSPADLKSKLSIKFKYDAGNKILTDGTLVFFRQRWGICYYSWTYNRIRVPSDTNVEYPTSE